MVEVVYSVYVVQINRTTYYYLFTGIFHILFSKVYVVLVAMRIFKENKSYKKLGFYNMTYNVFIALIIDEDVQLVRLRYY